MAFVMWLKRLVGMAPRYRIRAVGGGFTAEHRDSADMWWMLGPDGDSGVSGNSLPGRECAYLCKTMEGAGSRINQHAEMTGGKVVWDDAMAPPAGSGKAREARCV